MGKRMWSTRVMQQTSNTIPSKLSVRFVVRTKYVNIGDRCGVSGFCVIIPTYHWSAWPVWIFQLMHFNWNFEFGRVEHTRHNFQRVNFTCSNGRWATLCSTLSLYSRLRISFMINNNWRSNSYGRVCAYCSCSVYIHRKKSYVRIQRCQNQMHARWIQHSNENGNEHRVVYGEAIDRANDRNWKTTNEYQFECHVFSFWRNSSSGSVQFVFVVITARCIHQSTGYTNKMRHANLSFWCTYYRYPSCSQLTNASLFALLCDLRCADVRLEHEYANKWENFHISFSQQLQKVVEAVGTDAHAAPFKHSDIENKMLEHRERVKSEKHRNEGTQLTSAVLYSVSFHCSPEFSLWFFADFHEDCTLLLLLLNVRESEVV